MSTTATTATTATTVKTAKASRMSARYITVTGLLSAVAFVLMFLDFSTPFMPAFIKMDLSELPALIGAFAMGPMCGVLVCLIKNLLHLTMTSTGGVGEVSNFILGALFVLPAGLIYKFKKGRTAAIIGALVGAVLMSVLSYFTNYYFVYPIYENFMPRETIVAAYQAILPSVKNLSQCILVFNVPFNFVKSMISVVITLITYKKLSPILKG